VGGGWQSSNLLGGMMTIRASVTWLVALALVGSAATAFAQGGKRYPASQAFYQPDANQPGNAMAGAQFGQRAELIDAHGDPAVIPTQYCESCPPGGGCYGGGGGGGYGGGAYQVDQCGPHYFDFSVEYLSYQRDSIFNGQVGFTALNFNNDGTPPNLVLSSSDLDTDDNPGFRIMGRYDCGPLSVLEFGYSAFYDMNDQISFTDPGAQANGLGNLFSPFTNFGDGFLPESEVDPVEGGFDPADLQDFEETDRASSHTVVFNSDLQTAEMSYRRYWVGYSPRVSGTLLAGFRYSKLKEGLRFNTVGTNFLQGDADSNAPSGGIGTADLRISADNNLAGFQMGGDMWIAVVQGLRLGAEGKAGIYNNQYELTTSFTTSDGDPAFASNFKDNQVAFISEAKVMLVADILPSLSVRGGYEVLFLNSLALVGDNFPAGSPYANPNVPAFVSGGNDQGDAFFHGWNCGLEYIW